MTEIRTSFWSHLWEPSPSLANGVCKTLNWEYLPFLLSSGSYPLSVGLLRRIVWHYNDLFLVEIITLCARPGSVASDWVVEVSVTAHSFLNSANVALLSGKDEWSHTLKDKHSQLVSSPLWTKGFYRNKCNHVSHEVKVIELSRGTKGQTGQGDHVWTCMSVSIRNTNN